MRIFANIHSQNIELLEYIDCSGTNIFRLFNDLNSENVNIRTIGQLGQVDILASAGLKLNEVHGW